MMASLISNLAFLPDKPARGGSSIGPYLSSNSWNKKHRIKNTDFRKPAICRAPQKQHQATIRTSLKSGGLDICCRRVLRHCKAQVSCSAPPTTSTTPFQNSNATPATARSTPLAAFCPANSSSLVTTAGFCGGEVLKVSCDGGARNIPLGHILTVFPIANLAAKFCPQRPNSLAR